MMKLFVNNEIVDLIEQQEVATTIGALDFTDLKARAGQYTNNVAIRATNRMKTLFGLPNDINSTSTIPYVRQPFFIEVDGSIPVIGLCRVVNASNQAINLQLVGSSANWYTYMKSINMEDIDVRELNHYYTNAAVMASRANTWSNGYIYPNMDDGRLDTIAVQPDFTYFYPTLYFKYLFNKLFQQAGYTIQGGFLTDPLFEKMIISYGGDFRRPINPDLRWRWKVECSTDAINGSPAARIFKFDTLVSSTSYNPYQSGFNLVPLNGNEGIYGYVTDSGDYEIELNFIFDDVGGGGSLNIFNFVYYDYNTGLLTTEVLGGQALVLGLNTVTRRFTVPIQAHKPFGYTVAVSGVGVFGKAGSSIETLGFTPASNELVSQDDELAIRYELDPSFGLPTSRTFIQPCGTLGEIKTTEFLLYVFNFFGVVPSTNEAGKIITFEKFDDIAGNISNAIDWSDRIDLTEPPVYSFAFGKYAQRNIFRYPEDSSDEIWSAQPQTFRDGIFTINNPDLPIEKVVYESPFAGTLSRVTLNASPQPARSIAYVPRYDPSDNPQSITPKVGYIDFNNNQNIQIGINPIEPVQPQIFFNELQFVTSLDTGLRRGNLFIPINPSLFQSRYQRIFEILAQPKLVSLLLRLKPTDIENLDLTRLVWLDYFNACFYINKINQFKLTSKESTQVELILIR